MADLVCYTCMTYFQVLLPVLVYDDEKNKNEICYTSPLYFIHPFANSSCNLLHFGVDYRQSVLRDIDHFK